MSKTSRDSMKQLVIWPVSQTSLLYRCFVYNPAQPYPDTYTEVWVNHRGSVYHATPAEVLQILRIFEFDPELLRRRGDHSCLEVQCEAED